MERVKINKLSVGILASIMVLCMVLATVQGIWNIAYAESSSFENSNVLDDLRSSTVNGEAFNIKKYTFDGSKSLQVINVVEYCYSSYQNKLDNFGIYVYIYNPQGLEISESSLQNKIQITSGDRNTYSKYSIEFCNKSTEAAYYGLFYKFKIKDSKDLLNGINSHERIYKISGIELLIKGDVNATDYTVGGTYKFSGYSKGYGPNSKDESTLVCMIENLETLRLNVNHSTYRTGVSSTGANHYNQVSTVYFSVPNYIYDSYGNLQKIRAEWWEYKTQKALVTSNNAVYENFKKYTTTNVSYHSDSVNAKLYTNKTSFSNQYVSEDTYDWAYNIAPMDQSVAGYRKAIKLNSYSTIIPYVFYSESKELDDVFDFMNKQNVGNVTAANMAEYMYNYDDGSNIYIDCNGRKINAGLFIDSVDTNRQRGHNDKTISLEDTFNLDSYDSNHSWWNKLYDYGFSWPDSDEEYKDVMPIYELKAEDLISSTTQASKNLLINVNDIESLRSYYTKESLQGNHVVLFRFANTDYYAENIYGEVDGVSFDKKDKTAYIAQETVFFDFDIIELTFSNGLEEVIIPVVSSPIDIVGGLDAPIEELEIWKIILGIILGIILILILIPIMPMFVKAIVWVVALPFKLLIKIGKKCKKLRIKKKGRFR